VSFLISEHRAEQAWDHAAGFLFDFFGAGELLSTFATLVTGLQTALLASRERHGHTTVLLAHGKAFFGGAFADNRTNASTAVYDPHPRFLGPAFRIKWLTHPFEQGNGNTDNIMTWTFQDHNPPVMLQTDV
jgi:hypothetical protein